MRWFWIYLVGVVFWAGFTHGTIPTELVTAKLIVFSAMIWPYTAGMVAGMLVWEVLRP